MDTDFVNTDLSSPASMLLQDLLPDGGEEEKMLNYLEFV